MARFSLLALFLIGLGALPVHAATITVTTSADELNADGDCSLREAVEAANTNAAVDACAAGSLADDAIRFAPIAGQTISLTLGQMTLSDAVTIGDAASAVTIDAGGASRIFFVDIPGSARLVAFQNLTLRGGMGLDGGAVFVADGEMTVFTNVTFDANTATRSGGALRVGLGPAAHVLTDCFFRSNHAMTGSETGGGGAVFIQAGLLEVVGGIMRENTASVGAARGGALFIGPNATVTIRPLDSDPVSFVQNQAADAGGAIEVAGILILTRGSFVYNQTAGMGGGLHLTGTARATLATSVFLENEAGHSGGGIWNAAAGTLTLTGTDFLGNDAFGSAEGQGGGGLFSAGGTSTLLGVRFSGNLARVGGAILNTAAGRLTMAGGDIGRNTATRDGGGLATTAPPGTPGNLVSLTDVPVHNNEARSGAGGGLHVGGAGAMTVRGGSVLGNTATDGGGLWTSATGVLQIEGTRILSNTATGAGDDQGGGGVFSDSGAGLSIANAVISRNAATGSGGGLYLRDGATGTVSNTTITDNTASRSGGGIEARAGTTLALVRVTLSDNDAGPAPGNGGGLHNAGAVTIDSSLVAGSTAANQGGGLWNAGDGVLLVRYSTVSANVARAGGGLYQLASTEGLVGRTTVENTLVSGNRATAAGGGLAADGATVLLANTTLSGNLAAQGGGAATRGGRLVLSSVTIAANAASVAGGGLFNTDKGAATLLSPANTVVADNTAPTGPDLAGAVRSRGSNLFEATEGATITNEGGAAPDQAGVDPGLQPLADNGGPTHTHALLAGSPAVGTGQTTLAVDQRGYARTAPPSIGAFEFGGMPVGDEQGPVAEDRPAALALGPAMPNPFRSSTRLAVTVATPEPVVVTLFDTLGRQVRVLYAGTPSTPVEVAVDGRSLPSGVYVARLSSPSGTATRRLTVVR